LYKVIVLYETYRRTEEGQISLDHEIGIDASDLVEDDSAGLEPGDWISVDTALRLMITISSNAAAHALLDELGWSSFNAAAARLGLDETRMPVGGYGLQFDDWRQTITSTSPRDMLR